MIDPVVVPPGICRYHLVTLQHHDQYVLEIRIVPVLIQDDLNDFRTGVFSRLQKHLLCKGLDSDLLGFF